MKINEKNKEKKPFENKLTLKHAIWATFYVLITSVFTNIFVTFLIFFNFPKDEYLRIYYRLSPILFISVLVVFFIYISTRRDLNLRDLGFKKSGFKKAIIFGFITGVILGFISIIIIKTNISRAVHNLRMLFSHPIISAYGWGAISVSPVFEEAFYRGLWYRVLKEKMSKFLVIILISLVFAILHSYMRISHYFEAFFISIFLTIIYDKTNNLYSSIIAHSLINLFRVLFISKL